MKICLLIISGVILLSLISCGGGETSQMSAPAIPVYQVKGYDIPIYHEFVGQIMVTKTSLFGPG